MISPKSLKRLHRRRGSALPTLNLAVLVLLEDTTLLALLRKRSHRNRLLISRCSLCWIVPRVKRPFSWPCWICVHPSLCIGYALCILYGARDTLNAPVLGSVVASFPYFSVITPFLIYFISSLFSVLFPIRFHYPVIAPFHMFLCWQLAVV